MKRAPVSRAALAAAFAACCALAPPPASSAVFRIDETGTVVNQPVLPMQWRQLLPGAGADQTVAGAMRVDVRLNLQPWLNRPARIYLVLAPVNGPRVKAEWTSQGRLLPGTVYSGERAVVFEGPAGPATLSDSLLMLLETDGQRLTVATHLNFHFEIEVSP